MQVNLIGGQLGLDHDQVFFGRFGVPVMARYLDQRQAKQRGAMSAKERDKLLFWFVQAAMWGRFSGSTESFIDQDLAALEGDDGGLDKLLEQLRLWHGGLRAEPDHFTGWSLGARFYPVLYLLTRMGEAKDWGTGLPLKASLLGKMSRLEVHHIFPKAKLYKHKREYRRPEVNALANFCFQTKDTNLEISDRCPEEYFPKLEARHPGCLASQWVPMDPALWTMERFRDFLEAGPTRRETPQRIRWPGAGQSARRRPAVAVRQSADRAGPRVGRGPMPDRARSARRRCSGHARQGPSARPLAPARPTDCADDLPAVPCIVGAGDSDRIGAAQLGSSDTTPTRRARAPRRSRPREPWRHRRTRDRGKWRRPSSPG